MRRSPCGSVRRTLRAAARRSASRSRARPDPSSRCRSRRGGKKPGDRPLVPPPTTDEIRPTYRRLEEARVRFGLGFGSRAEVGAAERGDRAPARRPLDEAELEKVRLVEALLRLRVLADRPGQRVRARRPAAPLLHARPPELAAPPPHARLLDF